MQRPAPALAVEAAPRGLAVDRDDRPGRGLLGERGDEAGAALASRFAELVAEVVAERDGRLLELRGDEALVVFLSARKALRAAIELQARFSADLIDETKEPVQLPPEQRLARVGFYSYTRNVALQAFIRNGEVERLVDIEGLQPPESPEEIESAVSLAREDPRIRDDVTELLGRALLQEQQEGEPGFGNRVLYVSFLPRDSAQTEVMALVDLTEQRVIEARALGRPNRASSAGIFTALLPFSTPRRDEPTLCGRRDARARPRGAVPRQRPARRAAARSLSW